MKVENLRSLIRENIHSYLKEIDEAAKIGAIKASIAKCEEAIGVREKKMNMEGLDEAYHDMLDKGKMAELKSEIKALSKSLEKYKKQLAKFEKVDEVITDEAMVTDEVTEEAPIATEDVMSEMDVEETAINESFLKMQKLAGVITEAEYNQKKSLVENQLNENAVLDAMGTVLVGGIGLVLATAGVVGGTALALDNIQYGPIGDAIKKLKSKIDNREFNKYIKPILLRFKDDQELQDIIEKGATSSEIETYLESKLQPKELKYLKHTAESLWGLGYRKSDEEEKL